MVEVNRTYKHNYAGTVVVTKIVPLYGSYPVIPVICFRTDKGEEWVQPEERFMEESRYVEDASKR